MTSLVGSRRRTSAVIAIVGAHSIIYSKNPDAVLIFGLPPSEVAVHPAEENDVHEFYLMRDDLGAFIADMKERDIA